MFLEDRWTFVKLKVQENDFYAPDGDLTRKHWLVRRSNHWATETQMAS